MTARATAGPPRGFTLVEVVIAAALLAVISLAAITMLVTSRNGAEQARISSMRTDWLRRASKCVREELEQASSSHLAVATAPDLNQSITLQRPIACGGGITSWGAYDSSRPGDQRLRAGFFVRFTVVNNQDGRQLVRQLLDADQAVVREEMIAMGLASGSETPAGLRIVPSGDLYRVTIGLAGSGGRQGEAMTFDVALKN